MNTSVLTDLHPVVDFDPGTDKLLIMDFSAANKALSDELLGSLDGLCAYVNDCLQAAGARYGIGGYAEPRVLYRRHAHFGTVEEARSIHLGIDIWAAAGTPVYAPLNAIVHSVAFNNQEGDYGATIILEHSIENEIIHTLYGHLSLASIDGLYKGKAINAGCLLAHFGNLSENGNWPPHLHFQVIRNMEGKEGDYPGVCKPSEKEYYLKNCPDPEGLLHMMKYAVSV